jgi:N-acetylated-alpha-linked acidic dipeptidase
MAAPATQWQGGAAERAFLDTLNTEEPWALIHEFAHYVRESGTEGEQRAVDALTRRLAAWGIPHTVHHPRCFISLPRGADVVVTLTDGTARTLRATTPGFAVPTGDAGISGEPVVVEARHAADSGSLFASGLGAALAEQDVRGKVAVLNGLPMPARVNDLAQAGVAAAIFISPGTNVHEGICTTIWGTPDLDTYRNAPTLSAVEVNKPDGMWLAEQARGGMVREVVVHANLDTRWREIPVTVAEIKGAVVPEEFVLVHGHLDSWGEGIGDNATGDATLLELARALWQNRQNLARTVRVAWWSGHSHGRYAGSTWYADAFGLDLIEHCVAQVNCDSPGCRWATEYRDVSWMPELEAFTQAVIRDVTGQESIGERPPRAGDYSFNNLGISGTLMLSSTMPQSVADEHNYYAVGGCGGNIAWHTVDDTLEIADRANLERDIKVYGAVVWRLANAPIVPLDLAAAGADIKASLEKYQQTLGSRFDLGDAIAAADAFIAQANAFSANATASDAAAGKATNEKILRAGRELTALNFARRGHFQQDPALDVPPLPDLAAAVAAFAEAPEESHIAGVARTSLVRARNRAIWALREAGRELT